MLKVQATKVPAPDEITGAARHLTLVEYEHADIPVGRYSRPRDLDDYLALIALEDPR